MPPKTLGNAVEQTPAQRLQAFKRSAAANKKCFVCSMALATDVCMDFGTFVCQICGGLHRGFGHKIKSISLSEWNLQHVEGIESLGGNQRLASIWLAKFDTRRDMGLEDASDLEKVKEYIRTVFVEKKWFSDAAVGQQPQPQQQLPQQQQPPPQQQQTAVAAPAPAATPAATPAAAPVAAPAVPAASPAQVASPAAVSSAAPVVCPQATSASCDQCGAPFAEDAAFCGKCGRKRPEPKVLSAQCDDCGSPFQPDALFCGKCGKKRGEAPPPPPVLIPAPVCECGAPFLEDALFCGKCGAKRGQVPATSVPAQTVAAAPAASASPAPTVASPAPKSAGVSDLMTGDLLSGGNEEVDLLSAGSPLLVEAPAAPAAAPAAATPPPFVADFSGVPPSSASASNSLAIGLEGLDWTTPAPAPAPEASLTGNTLGDQLRNAVLSGSKTEVMRIFAECSSTSSATTTVGANSHAQAWKDPFAPSGVAVPSPMPAPAAQGGMPWQASSTSSTNPGSKPPSSTGVGSTIASLNQLQGVTASQLHQLDADKLMQLQTMVMQALHVRQLQQGMQAASQLDPLSPISPSSMRPQQQFGELVSAFQEKNHIRGAESMTGDNSGGLSNNLI